MAEQDCPICGEGPYSRVLLHVRKSHSESEMKQVLLDELERLAKELGGTPRQSDMNQCGRFSVNAYQNQFGSWNDALERVGLALNSEYNISEEQLLQEIKRLSEELGRTPTQKDMTQCGRFSSRIYHDKFSSWNEALEKIGLSPNAERDISEERLLQELECLSQELGRTPTAEDMNQWGRFSADTYDKFGSWNDALERVGLALNDEWNISEERLLQEIERLSEELGRTPTQKDMEQYGRFGAATYHNKFSSWNDALERVGLSPNRERDISEKRLLQEIERLSEELGRTPTQKDMARCGRFGMTTHYRRFGSWNEALDRVGLERNTYKKNTSAKRQRALKQWSRAIKARDGYTCQDCGGGDNLRSHHIKRRVSCEVNSDGVDEALALWNGICLCAQCHAHRHRGDWYHHLLKYEVENFSYRKAARRQSKNRKS